MKRSTREVPKKRGFSRPARPILEENPAENDLFPEGQDPFAPMIEYFAEKKNLNPELKARLTQYIHNNVMRLVSASCVSASKRNERFPEPSDIAEAAEELFHLKIPGVEGNNVDFNAFPAEIREFMENHPFGHLGSDSDTRCSDSDSDSDSPNTEQPTISDFQAKLRLGTEGESSTQNSEPALGEEGAEKDESNEVKD
ncbi:uncharacterized protein LOC100905254 [Galendromus occidentalis]|uniref:Uncharacterized protein LOC100905254 n=1 Tax=Galendromus occidentalis TaxID=34638 RepID=A0AAJ7L7C3_9ACAR|nr:uncharacterized protein LOC100905254 [Galendromus occidentalis]